MPLNEVPTKKTQVDFHFVFVEKIGPFQDTARAAWSEFHQGFPEIQKTMQIQGVMALYKTSPEMIYRAGAAVSAKPSHLPEGFRHEMIPGGPYASFLLTGSYAQLPEACGRVFEIIGQTKIPRRAAFNIESYLNDPSTTKEEELQTEILIPTF